MGDMSSTAGCCTIEDVEVHHLRTANVDADVFDGSYETTFVKVRADNGLEGYGEAESLPSAVRAIVEGPSAHSAARALREIVVGRDPTDVAGIHAAMYAGTEYIGRRGIVMHAIGALDIAIWDLCAKVAGVPIGVCSVGSRMTACRSMRRRFQLPTTRASFESALKAFAPEDFAISSSSSNHGGSRISRRRGPLSRPRAKWLAVGESSSTAPLPTKAFLPPWRSRGC